MRLTTGQAKALRALAAQHGWDVLARGLLADRLSVQRAAHGKALSPALERAVGVLLKRETTPPAQGQG